MTDHSNLDNDSANQPLTTLNLDKHDQQLIESILEEIDNYFPGKPQDDYEQGIEDTKDDLKIRIRSKYLKGKL